MHKIIDEIPNLTNPERVNHLTCLRCCRGRHRLGRAGLSLYRNRLTSRLVTKELSIYQFQLMQGYRVLTIPQCSLRARFCAKRQNVGSFMLCNISHQSYTLMLHVIDRYCSAARTISLVDLF